MRETAFRCNECRNWLGKATYTDRPGIYLFCSRRNCNTWTPREPGATVGTPIYCGVHKEFDRILRDRGISNGCGQFLGRITQTIGTKLTVRCSVCGRAYWYEDGVLRSGGRIIVNRDEPLTTPHEGAKIDADNRI